MANVFRTIIMKIDGTVGLGQEQEGSNETVGGRGERTTQSREEKEAQQERRRRKDAETRTNTMTCLRLPQQNPFVSKRNKTTMEKRQHCLAAALSFINTPHTCIDLCLTGLQT